MAVVFRHKTHFHWVMPLSLREMSVQLWDRSARHERVGERDLKSKLRQRYE